VRRAVLPVIALFLLPGAAPGGPGGYRLFESTAASVNGEVIFLSDVEREVCFHRCGMDPGEAAREVTPSRAREILIADMLVLQEQRKLGLGGGDNAALADVFAKVAARKAQCASPCAAGLSDADVQDFIRRRILVRDFLDRRVAVFVEVNDEEARREIALRIRAGGAPGDLLEEKVRKELFADKVANGVKSWFARAVSKSRIVLSPMGEP
jgi:hypothetical protein